MNNNFIRASLIRCVRTIAQTAIACIGTATVMSSVDWKMVVSASLLSGILSLLTSIATGLPEVDYAEHIYMSADEPEDSYVEEEGEADD